MQWRDTATVRKLQLRRASETGPEVLAELLVRGTSLTNKIVYFGQSSRLLTSPMIGNHATIYVCPNTVDAVTGVVQGEPHSFHFESNCSGQSGGACDARPNFVWTVIYTAQSGNTYKEQIADYTSNDFSKVYFYLYTRVPASNTATNLGASRSNGNLNAYQWVRPSSCGYVNTAQPGEPIVNVRLECSGYRCGFTNGLDEDFVNFPSIYMPPRPIDLLDVATGSVPSPTASLCRTGNYSLTTAQTYPLQNAPVVGGPYYPTYSWRATNGARMVIPATSVRGRPAYLDLSNVSPTATSVTVYASYSTVCGQSSYEQELTVPVVPPAPAPLTMQLTNGLCPGTGTKTVSVDLGSTTGSLYEWSISGANASFFGLQPITNSATISTPNAGAVTVSVRKQLTACAGYGPSTATTYQIGNLIPACVTPVAVRDYCFGSPQLVFETAPSGLNYYVGAITNTTNGIPITLTPVSPGSPVWTIGGVGATIVQFDLEYFIQSPCPGATGSGFIRCTTHVAVPKYIPRTCRGVAGSPALAETPEPQLYPNPTNGLVTIQADAATRPQQVKVFDAQGSLRIERHSDDPAGIQSFDLKDLAPGIYLVQLFDGKRLTSQRLVKE